MADFSEQTPFEGLYLRTSNNRRRLSYTSQTSGSLRSTYGVSTLHPNHLRAQNSSASVRSLAESEFDQSEIHAPMPRRHPLIQTESEQWLKARSLSPSSSRPVSPLSPNRPKRVSKRSTRREHTPSISSVLEDELATQKQLAKLAEKKKPEEEANEPAGKRLIKWMHSNQMRDRISICLVAAAALIKWCIGMGSYSGQNTPPMYGDYEAQRHWMEITNHLPLHRWYTYDLQYWGLDYPPLTAYHSWLCGFIGTLIDPNWFALDKSRGIENEDSKLFMRATVVVSDLLVYVPALIYFVQSWHNNRTRRTQSLALLSLLLQPSLLLIDFGHFQYNSVMLGFTVLALNFFADGQDELGAVMFVASLGFKQMALYYAPAIGSYLLGKCFYLGPREGITLFIRLGITTTLSFAIVFLPFLPPFASPSSILDPIARIFPFARGLFEDKVANFWCASNVVLKWRIWFSQPQLVKMSALFTALGFFPAVIILLWTAIKLRGALVKEKNEAKVTARSSPTLPILPWALLTSSMSFFLFSFQVHEKSILLPLLPLNLLFSGSAPGTFTFEWCALVNNVAVFSMWPLLKKDGLCLRYFAVSLLWNNVIGYNPLRKSAQQPKLRLLALGIYAYMFTLHILEAAVSPPVRYPDLYTVLNVLMSTSIFGLTWLWSIKRVVEVSWGVSGIGLGGESKSSSSSKKS